MDEWDKLKEAATIARKKADAATAAAEKAATARKKAAEDVKESTEDVFKIGEIARDERDAWKKKLQLEGKPVPRVIPTTKKWKAHRSAVMVNITRQTALERREAQAIDAAKEAISAREEASAAEISAAGGSPMRGGLGYERRRERGGGAAASVLSADFFTGASKSWRRNKVHIGQGKYAPKCRWPPECDKRVKVLEELKTHTGEIVRIEVKDKKLTGGIILEGEFCKQHSCEIPECLNAKADGIERCVGHLDMRLRPRTPKVRTPPPPPVRAPPPRARLVRDDEKEKISTGIATGSGLLFADVLPYVEHAAKRGPAPVVETRGVEKRGRKSGGGKGDEGGGLLLTGRDDDGSDYSSMEVAVRRDDEHGSVLAARATAAAQALLQTADLSEAKPASPHHVFIF
jgi:hypothetical protein